MYNWGEDFADNIEIEKMYEENVMQFDTCFSTGKDNLF